MASKPETKPIEDTVAQVDNELAVGEDLKFQRKWWVFERVAWILLTIILILDLLGVFGRGYLAHAEVRTTDGSMDINYEHVERFKTPSILTVKLSPMTVHDGKVNLWTSQSLVTGLGAQRVIPQPVSSVVGNGGILYTFDAARNPTSIEFALEPGKIGAFDLELGVSGLERSKLRIFVMP